MRVGGQEGVAGGRPVARVDTTLMEKGPYEVSPDDTFEIEIHLSPKEGRWVMVKEKGGGVDTHKVVFRMWTYDEMVSLKRQATSYDQTKRIHMIDADMMNRLKIQKFMQSWTFGGKNENLKIHRVQGVLSDESWKKVASLQPSILVYIIDKMNEVYEYNG